jgi:hypothetical protein
MDQTTMLTNNDRLRAVARLAEFVAQSVDAARAVEKPFFHLEFDRVFPDDVYAQILALMPEATDYVRCTAATRATISPTAPIRA